MTNHVAEKLLRRVGPAARPARVCTVNEYAGPLDSQRESSRCVAPCARQCGGGECTWLTAIDGRCTPSLELDARRAGGQLLRGACCLV
jgi:hypothetical protein